MAPAGFLNYSSNCKTKRSIGVTLDEVEELIIPDLQLLFDMEKTAFENWEKFSRSVKRGILEWILNAKRTGDKT